MHPIFDESTKLGRLRAIKVFAIQKGAMMKRVLLLLLLANCLQADPVADLEKAVSKSDLQSVEKLLAGDISISADEKAALINLASEIITKRENKIYINSIPTSCKKYLVNNLQLKHLLNESRGFAALSIIITLIYMVGINPLIHYLEGIVNLPAKLRDAIYNNDLIGAWPLFGIFFASAVHSMIKHDTLYRKLVVDHNKKYSNQRDCAIQIRQLLYKIKVQ